MHMRNLWRKSLWEQRYMLAAFACGLVAISFYLAYMYPFFNRSTQVLKMIESLPPFIKKMLGNTMLGTPEGFFSFQPFAVFTPLLYLIYALLRGADAISGEEERGTLDLLLVSPLSRTRIVLAKTGAALAGLAVITLAFWIGMLGALAHFGIPLSRRRLTGAVFAAFLLGCAFFGLTLLAGALLRRRKRALGVLIAIASVTYLINAYAPMVPDLQSLLVFSPFHFYNGNNPLLNGLDPIYIVIQSAIALVSIAGAILVFNHRDVGV
jgi:ABC-2 type transport system permease protein